MLVNEIETITTAKIGLVCNKRIPSWTARIILVSVYCFDYSSLVQGFH